MNLKESIHLIIIGVVTGVITSILPAIWFQITTGNWLNLFLSINPFYYFIMVVAIVIFIIIIGLILFCRSKKKTSPYSASGSIHGYDLKTKYLYEKVLWPVDILKENPIPNARPLIDVRDPLCPKCKTELKISNGFLRDTWKCVDCKFKKKTCDNVSNLKEEVKKIVKADLEKGNI